ncbi:hypothetical protein VTN49DRAFT_5870 [Thermomyces lanuginosus]|uniref:uncharacterized protein n=1 Tax=Thermomyces lanuginosus TaxID=5541 RepID=UPI00374240E0
MREVNFSIPNVNKAAVNITTTLYDRRALDCTSTLPLINSLNHLAYLTTSSARIRDILTVDGGIERLVCILKEGRSKDLMEMWKWSLAFQCVVNIGVRGSESVRTRVVEADMVPVIATILDNYIKVVDKIRAKMDAEQQHRRHLKAPVRPREPAMSISSTSVTGVDSRTSRRQAPPPSIEIPQPFPHEPHPHPDPNAMDVSPSPPHIAVTSPPERTTFGRDVHNPRSHDARYQQQGLRPVQPIASAGPTSDSFRLRLAQQNLRLPDPPRTSSSNPGVASQPASPTTPGGVPQLTRVGIPQTARRSRAVPRQQQSGSGESDDANGEDSPMAEVAPGSDANEPIVQNGMEMDNVPGGDSIMLDEVSDSRGLTMADQSRAQDAETFNITHRSSVDGSIVNTNNPQAPAALPLSPSAVPNHGSTSTVLNSNPYSAFLRSHNLPQHVLAVMPRDEDVLMSLQLLAYISKYCNLRSYFQNTHLVPKLTLKKELAYLDDPTGATVEDTPDEEPQDEYLLPDDFNIFPLVEKFTVHHHSKDMQYWACVVMRNLCRKDESRGGIRQCAYYKCGKWEEYQRQFAKCRRCRRTKYCSKDCQKAAWVYHRHWCHSSP